MNSRRLMPIMGFDPSRALPASIMTPASERRRQAVCRISSLPVEGLPVLKAGLNCSESSWSASVPMTA
jgi:hypothetical protein